MMLKKLILTWYFCCSKNANKINVHKAKIRMYPAGIYLLKVNNENSITRCVIGSKLTTTTKKHWNHHNDMRTLRNIDVAVVSLYLFLVFHLWTLGSVISWVYQKSKCGQIKIMKHWCKISHSNQTAQTTTWKETCIEFVKYSECRLWASIYQI